MTILCIIPGPSVEIATKDAATAGASSAANGCPTPRSFSTSRPNGPSHEPDRTGTPASMWQVGEGDVITVPWGHPRTVTVEAVNRPDDFSQQVWLHWTADGASGRLLVPAYARIEIVSSTRQLESHEDALARIARALTEGTT